MTYQPRPIGAVFLSYAREDGEAARHIAEALRAFGVEVWFDMSELRGGDVWDQKIRRQIKDCALFVAVISTHTQAREEGYFRREWRMAVDRTHDMAENRAFIVPVIVDDTRESDANVPEQFLKAHCTRLPGGEPTPQFVDQVKRLLQPARAGDAGSKSATRASLASPVVPTKSGFPVLAVLLGVAVIALVALVLFRPAAKPDPAAVAAPPPNVPAKAVEPAGALDDKSIAVLPFVDMSQTKDQEYFSDGLSEELLNLLAKVPALQVTSRSSAFSYKGKEIKLAQVARELNVAHILEGSVRKSGNKLRITAQLIDARTDKHLWSETYDRPLDDIFTVQDEIAAAVVAQLKVTLLGAAPKAKAVNPKAYALFLQARQLSRLGTAEALDQAIAVHEQALAIDPNLAASWEGLAYCYISQTQDARSTDEGFRLARDAVNKALAIEPALAVAHARLGNIARTYDSDLVAAAGHLEHALSLEPANAEIIAEAMGLMRDLGRLDQNVALMEYIVAHDPVNVAGLASLGNAYIRVGRYDEGIATIRTALRLSPNRLQAHYGLGKALLEKGEFKAALAEFQQEASRSWHLEGVTLASFALGEKSQSDAALAELIRKEEKDASWNISYVFAYRGEADRAFEWLNKAIGYHDTGLSDTPVEWLFTNLHKDPRWLPFLRKIGKAPEQLAAIKFDVKVPGK